MHDPARRPRDAHERERPVLTADEERSVLEQPRTPPPTAGPARSGWRGRLAERRRQRARRRRLMRAVRAFTG
jgi:hypothetical protein